MLEMLECWLIFALNILDVFHNTEEIIHAYNSKHNLKHENQVILLMITDCKSSVYYLCWVFFWKKEALKTLHCKQKVCYICKEEFSANDEKYQKVTEHCHYTGKHRGAAHDICNFRYKTRKEIPLMFHNSFAYDYHFIINELVKAFKG